MSDIFLGIFEVAQDVQIYQHDYFESYNYYGLLRFMDKIVFGRLHRNYEFYSSRRTHIPIFRWSVADMLYEVATCQTYSDGKIVIFLSLSPIFLGVFPAHRGSFSLLFGRSYYAGNRPLATLPPPIDSRPSQLP